jgi:hypothetical protein
MVGVIFGLKNAEVTGGYRKLYNEALHKIHSSSNRIRYNRHIAHMGDMKNSYILTDKPEEKRAFGRPRHT